MRDDDDHTVDADEHDHAADARWLTDLVACEPHNAVAWFDLGLAHKYLGNWRASADANLRAVEIESEPGDPAWWNLGIAATALRDWPLARRAWLAYGIEDEELRNGAGPFELNWNTNPVRIFSADRGTIEIVWGRRICPARIRIASIPYPASEHRWGDVVMHDGASNGERIVGEQTYPVFDELLRWSPSEIPTLQSNVRCASDDDAKQLTEDFDDAHFAAEDWSTSVRPLCKECSESTQRSHEHAFPTGGEERTVGIAAPMGLASQVLRAWRAASPATRDYDEPVPVG